MNHLTMKKFCHLGRSANQCFRYMFLEKYAREHGLELQTPEWIGQRLFGIENPPISVDLPEWRETGGGLVQPTPPEGDELVNRDFYGHCQYHTGIYDLHEQTRICKMFQPVPELLERVKPARGRLRGMGSTVIGIHLRRGDYGRRIFPVIPVAWYQAWLRENWKRFDDPVLFIASRTIW